MRSADKTRPKSNIVEEGETSTRPSTPIASNLLLAGLPETSQKLLNEVTETIEVKTRQVLHAQDKPLHYAIFPCDALVSVTMRSNGKAVEIAMIGDEGFFGMPLFFGTDNCPMTALVQVGGRAIRIKARDFQQAISADRVFAAALGRYAQSFSVMLALSAVCYATHVVEQRCAKWLLMAHDRVRTDVFPLTQELLAQMLGVRRSTVSEVAERMQHDGLIRYRQGRMTILDRPGLEELTCPCYGVERRQIDDILRPLSPPVEGK
jgi:CRP-like cAMP-binding protein